MNPIELTDDIVRVIQKKYIILIFGDMGSGKTTEATEIGSIFNKPVKVIVNNEHQEDIELFDKEGFEKIIVSSESDKRQSLKPQLKGVKDYTIIYDDYENASQRHKKTIQDLSIDLRKRKLKLILIYHKEEKLPKSFLKDNSSILIVKKNSGIERYKFSQYLKVKGISTSAVDLCKDIKDYDSIYLLKNGKYFHKDGITNKIEKGILKSRVVVDVDEKIITDTLLASGLTQREIAEDYGVSVSTLYKIVKRRKERDTEFAKLYRNLKKEKRLCKKAKLGKIVKSGVSLHIEVENLAPIQNENIPQIAYLRNLKNIGDFAVEVIGEGIYEGFQIEVEKGNIRYAEILIRKGRGGVDITIDIEERKIEIEVKNIKKTPKKKHITPSTTKRDIISRYSNQATDKYVFTCGIGFNNKSKDILRENDIKYRRLSYRQLKKGDRDRKYHIKKVMGEFVKDILI